LFPCWRRRCVVEGVGVCPQEGERPPKSPLGVSHPLRSIITRLSCQEKRASFDIHSYGSNILQKMPTDSKSKGQQRQPAAFYSYASSALQHES
jgi:hypothetical protein